jgi:hypothetical protein
MTVAGGESPRSRAIVARRTRNRAAFYRILATIPGITITQNAVDATGRHGTAFTGKIGQQP